MITWMLVRLVRVTRALHAAQLEIRRLHSELWLAKRDAQRLTEQACQHADHDEDLVRADQRRIDAAIAAAVSHYEYDTRPSLQEPSNLRRAWGGTIAREILEAGHMAVLKETPYVPSQKELA